MLGVLILMLCTITDNEDHDNLEMHAVIVLVFISFQVWRLFGNS